MNRACESLVSSPHLQYGEMLCRADRPEAGSYWEIVLAAAKYVPNEDWLTAAYAFERAAVAYERLGQRDWASQSYSQAAQMYECVGQILQAQEMRALANDVQQIPYL